MEILRRPIQQITFEDVVTFCHQSIIEGIQLDYKKDIPHKGLAKHFAAFSNARGGLIIIGVEEDSSTGKPCKWEGIDPAGKPEDRIHQFATQVDPVPRYDVCSTNADANGKVFALVRILEGDLTPYYVINDANIHIRTGNITNRCIELASPQEAARLFGKRENALLARNVGLQRAELVYQSAIDRFHKQHKRWHKENLRTTAYSPASIPKAGTLTITLQPHFPAAALIPPRELMSELGRLAQSSRSGHNWLRRSSMEPTQDGVLIVRSQIHQNAKLQECQEVFSSGLIFGRCSLESSLTYSGEPGIKIGALFSEIYAFLMTAREIYQSMKYQGGLVGYVELSQLEHLQVSEFDPAGRNDNDPHDILLPSYKWSITTDTSQLFDAETLKRFFFGLANEIGWSFGWYDDHEERLNYAIDKRRWER